MKFALILLCLFVIQTCNAAGDKPPTRNPTPLAAATKPRPKENNVTKSPNKIVFNSVHKLKICTGRRISAETELNLNQLNAAVRIISQLLRLPRLDNKKPPTFPENSRQYCLSLRQDISQEIPSYKKAAYTIITECSAKQVPLVITENYRKCFQKPNPLKFKDNYNCAREAIDHLEFIGGNTCSRFCTATQNFYRTKQIPILKRLIKRYYNVCLKNIQIPHTIIPPTRKPKPTPKPTTPKRIIVVKTDRKTQIKNLSKFFEQN